MINLLLSALGIGAKNNAPQTTENEYSYSPKKSFFTPQMLIVLTIIGLILYFIFSSKSKKKAKDKASAKERENPLPKVPEGTQINVSEEHLAKLRALAYDMLNDMKGLSLTNDETIYAKFNGHSDTDFVRVCNYFNQIPYVVENWDDYKGLKTWILEVDSDVSKPIIERMTNLGVKA